MAGIGGSLRGGKVGSDYAGAFGGVWPVDQSIFFDTVFPLKRSIEINGGESGCGLRYWRLVVKNQYGGADDVIQTPRANFVTDDHPSASATSSHTMSASHFLRPQTRHTLTRSLQPASFSRSSRHATNRLTSTSSPSASSTQSSKPASSQDKPQSSPKEPEKPEKSQAELDAELRERLEAMSGGGGEAGLELEDGKPVAMKRGTKTNMFRLI